MKIDFSKTMSTDHARCVALLSKVRARSAEWPTEWARAKAAGNQKLMKTLLIDAEALALAEKTLQHLEIKMRTELLRREHSVNRIMIEQTAKREEQAGTEFSKRLALKYQRAALEDERKRINQQTVRMGMDYLRLRMNDLTAGGVTR